MMFIVRTRGEPPHGAGVRIAAVRKTPDIVPDGAGQRDYFCVGDDDAPERLRGQGWNVVSLRDGWYGRWRGWDRHLGPGDVLGGAR